MSAIARVVICGQSVFVLAIESSLATLPGVEVIRLHAHLPALLERILTLHPNVVVLEQKQSRSNLTLALLDLGLPVITLDIEQMQGTLITSRSFPVSDLTKLIFSQES